MNRLVDVVWRHGRRSGQRRIGTLAIVLGSGVIMACSGGSSDAEDVSSAVVTTGDDRPGTSAATPPVSTTASTAPVSQTPPPSVSADTATTNTATTDNVTLDNVTLEERQRIGVRLPSPDWMTADELGVWVKLDGGTIEHVDPGSFTVLTSVEVADELCQGIGSSFGSIWACAGPGIVRVDPALGEVVARIDVNKAFSQGNLAGGYGRVWVLVGDGSTLVAIDPDTNAVAESFDLPVRGGDLAVGDAGLWVVSSVDDRVLRIDPVTGEVLLTVELVTPLDVSATDQVWVGAARSTVRLDPLTAETLTEVPYGTGPYGAISVDGGDVWIRSAATFLTRVDASTGDPIEVITGDLESGGDVIVAHGAVWATAYDDAQVVVLDPRP